MSNEPPSPAARLHDPVAHSHALGGFLAGALVGLAAAAGVAIVVGMAATLVATEVATAGLATPLVAGVAVTVGEFAINAVVGGKLMGLAEDAGEALGSRSMGSPSGEISQGSRNVLINGLPAARVTDTESCDAGKIAQGSATVFINGLPAARVGDKVTCGAVIVGGSGNVSIGGGTTSPLPIQSEVPEWARWAAVVVGILPALGGLARAIGPALAEVEATGLVRAAQTGVKALGRQMEARAGGVGPSSASPFLPKKIGELEVGAVPITPELNAARDAAKLRTGQTAAGYPPLPDDAAQTFGPGVRPWQGDEGGTLRRVVDADSNPAGSFWQQSDLTDEPTWRGSAAVRNDWNGDGGYVEAPAKGLKGWIGPAAPQDASVPGYMLPGSGEQIWIPRDAAVPGDPLPTPWNRGTH